MNQFREGIAPHGGTLVNRIVTAEQQQIFLDKANFLPRISLDQRAASDLVMIAIGGFSPLTGFMAKADYDPVVTDMRLANGLPWAVPVTLSVSEEVAESLEIGGLVRLDDSTGRFIGVLELTEKYAYDKVREAVNVYRTDAEQHPGVKVVYAPGSDQFSLAQFGYSSAIPIRYFLPIKLIPPNPGLCSAKRDGKR